MKATVIIENSIVRIELRPENEFEKRLILDCKKEGYNKTEVEAFARDSSYSYIPSEDKLIFKLSKVDLGVLGSNT